MLTVTDSAKEELKRIAETRGPDPGKYLRLAMPPVWTGEGSFGIVLDEEGSNDYVVVFQGTKVLLIEQDLAKQFPEAVFDFVDTPDGSQFTLDVY